MSSLNTGRGESRSTASTFEMAGLALAGFSFIYYAVGAAIGMALGETCPHGIWEGLPCPACDAPGK